MSINLREMFLNDYLSKCAENNKFEIVLGVWMVVCGAVGQLRWPNDCPLSQCASAMTTYTEHTWNHDKR